MLSNEVDSFVKSGMAQTTIVLADACEKVVSITFFGHNYLAALDWLNAHATALVVIFVPAEVRQFIALLHVPFAEVAISIT